MLAAGEDRAEVATNRVALPACRNQRGISVVATVAASAVVRKARRFIPTEDVRCGPSMQRVSHGATTGSDESGSLPVPSKGVVIRRSEFTCRSLTARRWDSRFRHWSRRLGSGLRTRSSRCRTPWKGCCTPVNSKSARLREHFWRCATSRRALMCFGSNESCRCHGLHMASPCLGSVGIVPQHETGLEAFDWRAPGWGRLGRALGPRRGYGRVAFARLSGRRDAGAPCSGGARLLRSGY